MSRFRFSPWMFATLLLGLSGGCDSPPPRLGAAAWFVDISSESGLDFEHETGATGELLLPEIMAGGAALFDFDVDGDLDIYLTQGNHRLGKGESAESPTNRLYRQEDDGRFVDVTSTSGLGDAGYGMGVAVGDIDNDGAPDVYVTNYGPDRLYLNHGDGTFRDVTSEAGIGVSGWSCSATFFDFDLDGYLDLYVTRYVRYDPRKDCIDSAGRPDYCSPKVFPAATDVLLRNNGDGSFADVSRQAGIEADFGAGLGVVAEDFSGDGRPDVYVANDGYPNQLWINQGDGSFVNEALIRGVAFDLHGRPEAGMGVLAADLDNDLDLDLFLTHLANESNTFYRNRGAGEGYEDATGETGLAASSLVHTGFGTAAFDIALDGDLDLLVANGRVTRGRAREASPLGPFWSSFAEPNLVYLQSGQGRFEPAVSQGAEFTTPVEISRGLATGDIDADGDLDLLLSNVQSGARLYRNEAPRSGSWLMVRALDPRYRRDAIGAQVTAFGPGLRILRTITRGFSYLSSSDPRAHFGLGALERLDRIEVHWPDGLRESFAVPELERLMIVERGRGTPL